MRGLKSTLEKLLNSNKKYAIFNMIPDYKELDYSYTSVYFCADEQIEDRFKFSIKNTPEMYFKSKKEVIKEALWLNKHYLTTAYFKIICLDDNRKCVYHDVWIVKQQYDEKKV